jgi:long-chain fatty acid transport protein
MNPTHRAVISVTVCFASAAWISNAHAAGFQLFEQSVSGLGTSFASTAAAEDASTVYWNPAGMSFLKNQNNFISAGVQILKPTAKFSNNGSTTGSGTALRGGNGGDIGEATPLPNLYYAHRFNNGLGIGVGVSSHFGLKTEYDEDWVGRYQAIKSELRTVTINPSISYGFGDRFAIGGGIDILKADAELTNKINFGAVVPVNAAAPALGTFSQQADGRAKISGDDLAYGFTLGGMLKLGEATKLSLTYHSKVDVKVDGDASFSAPSITSATLPVGPGGSLVTVPLSPAQQAQITGAFNANFQNQGVNAEVTLPEYVSFAAHSQIDEKWAVMGDITWTRWSRFKELRVKFKNGTLGDSVTQENWDDTFKVAVGVTYKPIEKLALRFGVAYDQQAADDKFLTPRIPDSSRTWVSFGLGYHFTPQASIDVGYAHIFVDNTSINRLSEESVPQLRTTVNGSYKSNVDILAAQFNYNF